MHLLDEAVDRFVPATNSRSPMATAGCLSHRQT